MHSTRPLIIVAEAAQRCVSASSDVAPSLAPLGEHVHYHVPNLALDGSPSGAARRVQIEGEPRAVTASELPENTIS